MAMTNQENSKYSDQIKVSNQLDQTIIEKGELTRVDVSNKIERGNFKLHCHIFYHMKII